MAPAVSIIVPVYNVEKFLPRCLDSLISQTIQDIEIICVNDASPDNSQKILEEYQKKFPDRIKLLVLKENSGLGGARNAGIRVAQGEYIGLVDSDDFVMTTMFEKLYTAAKQNDADIADCDYYFFDNNKYEHKISNPPEQFKIEDPKERKKNFVLRTGRLWTKIIRKRIYTDNNIFFPEKKFFEDIGIFPLIIAKANKIVKVNEPLYVYCKNHQSITNVTNNYKFFDRIDTLKAGIEAFKKHGIFEEFKDELEFRMFDMLYIGTSLGALKKFRPVPFDKIEEAKITMHSFFPHFLKNKYVKNRISTDFYIKLYHNALEKKPRTLQHIYLIIEFIAVTKRQLQKLIHPFKSLLRSHIT